MNVKIFLKVTNFLDKLLIFEDKFFWLFGLELEFTGKLMIL